MKERNKEENTKIKNTKSSDRNTESRERTTKKKASSEKKVDRYAKIILNSHSYIYLCQGSVRLDPDAETGFYTQRTKIPFIWASRHKHKIILTRGENEKPK